MGVKLFTDDQVEAVRGFIIYLQEQMDLTDWQIKLKHEPVENSSSDAGAAILTTYGRKVASLWLAHDFFSFTIEEIEHFLIHEMCHLFSTFITDAIENGPEALMGTAAFAMFNEHYKAALERMTDHIAVVIRHLISDGENRKEVIAALEAVRITS